MWNNKQEFVFMKKMLSFRWVNKYENLNEEIYLKKTGNHKLRELKIHVERIKYDST